MSNALSVIIPCFNASKTLEEAVSSCLRQNIDRIEIILVDDGSTDDTKELIERLAEKHPEVRALSHTGNKGGGAARNTGAAAASNETLFFLDSDDILPDGTLGTMLAYLQEKVADAVGIETSVKFRGSDTRDIEATDTFIRSGERIQLDDLLQHEGLCSLYSTFMIVRSAFERAGGYPTHHGFDTQGFAWRFLASDGIAYTCPGTRYLHRVAFHESYYLREANTGRVNYNWFDIFDEHIGLFSKPTQNFILGFSYEDIGENLFDSVRAREKSLLPVTEMRLRRTALEAQEETSLDATDAYWLGSEYLKEGRLQEAETFFGHALARNATGSVKEKVRLVSLLQKGFSNSDARDAIIRSRHYNKRTSLRGIIYRIRKRTRLLLATNDSTRRFLLGVYFAYQDIRARAKSRHAAALIASWLLLIVQKIFRYRITGTCPTEPTEIDIVIPTVAKDRMLLAYYLSQLRKNLCSSIGTIFVVAPDDVSIREFCAEEGLTFVDECSVLGYGKESISYAVNGVDRRGWLFQQLLKLSGDQFVTAERYVIVDSDTLLIRPHAFFEHGKHVFFENMEWQETYFRAFERLFGYEAPTRRSFTSHMMGFEVGRLREMKAEIETSSGMSWDKAYIEAADRTDPSGISDYDTYANWLLHTHPESVTRKPFYNRSFSRKRLGELERLVETCSERNASLSFHSYNA